MAAPAPEAVAPEAALAGVGQRELVVVAHADAGLRVSTEGVSSVTDADVTSLERLVDSEGVAIERLFGLSEDRLNLRRASLEMVAEAAVPDLSVYYRVQAPDERLDELAEAFIGQDVVEAAYVKPPGELPQILNDMAPNPEDGPPVTPDYNARQIYLDAAPAGIDARYAWTVSGGRGAGVDIIDLEWGWRFSHEDLIQNQGGVVGGTAVSNTATDAGSLRSRNHGTAVIGEIGGDTNMIGISGICPDAQVSAVAFSIASASAIRLAADRLGAGDIILLEIHRAGPRFNFQARNDQLGYIAIEWWPDDFDAIRYAVSRGVIVVEAAGNGAENLDDAIYGTRPANFPMSWTNPFNRANRDSGAIVVGAGAPPPGTHGADHGPDRSRLDFSNFGALIDAQGWGREVTTTGYGSLQGGTNEDEWYTDTFSGTSSASPIVVGALGCVQGVLLARGRTPLTPALARQYLRATGSPQQDAPGRPATQRIGNRPNLRELIDRATKGTLFDKGMIKDKEFKENLKAEMKEMKLEKAEKLEQKEQKIEKPEKEKIEVKEKIEIKEKDKDRFEGKHEIVEEKHFEGKLVEGKRFEGKRFEGKLVEGFIGGGGGPSSPASMEERLARVENAVTQLAHFITGELRPDLSQGALSNEPDAGGVDRQDLAKEATDAKAAKDGKDTEKPYEG